MEFGAIGGIVDATVAPLSVADVSDACSPVSRSLGREFGGLPPSMGAGAPTIPPVILICLTRIRHTYHP